MVPVGIRRVSYLQGCDIFGPHLIDIVNSTVRTYTPYVKYTGNTNASGVNLVH